MTRSPVIRLDDLTLSPQTQGTRFHAAMAVIAAPLGSTHLGARLVEVPPGKAAWPFHSHHANDEMFVILSGAGELRFGAEADAVAAGMVAVCPAGGAVTAHQMIAIPLADPAHRPRAARPRRDGHRRGRRGPQRRRHPLLPDRRAWLERDRRLPPQLHIGAGRRHPPPDRWHLPADADQPHRRAQRVRRQGVPGFNVSQWLKGA